MELTARSVKRDPEEVELTTVHRVSSRGRRRVQRAVLLPIHAAQHHRTALHTWTTTSTCVADALRARLARACGRGRARTLPRPPPPLVRVGQSLRFISNAFLFPCRVLFEAC